jgi:hypothetical protein
MKLLSFDVLMGTLVLICVLTVSFTCSSDVDKNEPQEQVQETPDVVFMGIITYAEFLNGGYATGSKMIVHTDQQYVIVLKQVYRVKIGDSLFVYSKGVSRGYELYRPWED